MSSAFLLLISLVSSPWKPKTLFFIFYLSKERWRFHFWVCSPPYFVSSFVGFGAKGARFNKILCLFCLFECFPYVCYCTSAVRLIDICEHMLLGGIYICSNIYAIYILSFSFFQLLVVHVLLIWLSIFDFDWNSYSVGLFGTTSHGLCIEDLTN